LHAGREVGHRATRQCLVGGRLGQCERAVEPGFACLLWYCAQTSEQSFTMELAGSECTVSIVRIAKFRRVSCGRAAFRRNHASWVAVHMGERKASHSAAAVWRFCSGVVVRYVRAAYRLGRKDRKSVV